MEFEQYDTNDSNKYSSDHDNIISSVHSDIDYQANESSLQNDSLNIQLQRLKGDQECNFIKNRDNQK